MTHNEFFFDLSKEERRDKVQTALVHITVRDSLMNPINRILSDNSEEMEVLKILAGAYMNGELKEDSVAIDRVRKDIDRDVSISTTQTKNS